MRYDVGECDVCGHEIDWYKYDYCQACEAGYEPVNNEPLDEIEAERNANV